MRKFSIVLSNNEELLYQDIGNHEDVLVLVHGNMSSGVHFKPIINELSTKYRVIIPDMRGFGDSSYYTPLESLDDLSKDLIELLAKLKISKYSIAGWSTGGAVILKMAVLDKEKVEKLVLIESCSYKGYPIFKKNEQGEPLVGEYYDNIDDLALDPVQVKPMLDIFETNNKPIINAVWDQAIYTVNKPSEEDNDLFLDETLKQRNLREIDWALTTFNMSNEHNGVTQGDNTIKEVTQPVLSIWGDKDIIVLEYMIDETVQALSNCKKVVLEDSGHSPLIDKPSELVALIKDFL